MVWPQQFLPWKLLIKIQDISLSLSPSFFCIYLITISFVCFSYFTSREDNTELIAIKNNFLEVPHLTKIPYPKRQQEVVFCHRCGGDWVSWGLPHCGWRSSFPCAGLWVPTVLSASNERNVFCMLTSWVSGSNTTAVHRNTAFSVYFLLFFNELPFTVLWWLQCFR